MFRHLCTIINEDSGGTHARNYKYPYELFHELVVFCNVVESGVRSR